MHFLWEILQEIFKICKSSVGNAAGNAVGNSVGNVVGNAAGNAEGNLVGNGWGNDAVFSLNMWLRMIYCLLSIQASMCNSYTFSICVQSLHFDPLLFKVRLSAHYCSKSPFWPIIAGSFRVSLFIDLGFP